MKRLLLFTVVPTLLVASGTLAYFGLELRQAHTMEQQIVQRQNNLKNLGLSSHNFHDAVKFLPYCGEGVLANQNPDPNGFYIDQPNPDTSDAN